jgi:hypothetical protein
MKKALVALALALVGSASQAVVVAAPIPGVAAIDWNNDGTFAKTGDSAVFYDSAHQLLWSNTTIDLGTPRSFEQALSLLATYNVTGSIEGVTNWKLPTVDQFKLLYATQGPDTVTNNGMEKRVFDHLGTYVWVGTPLDVNAPSHEAFAANSTLNASGQFVTYGNATKLAVWAVAAVPEPETYAMLLSGLACIGLIARRRKTTGA